jgi:D-arabinose 1-dehydrogenase-like Zn-dependent alcohol dehydrogenase
MLIEAFGGPEELVLKEVPRPEPGPGQVRVAVRSCGVCRHDALTRRGAFPKISLPVILGHQVAGVVDTVGPGVAGLQRGQRVMSLVYETCGRCDMCRNGVETHCRERPRFLGEDIDGGYAEYVVAGERTWIELPDGLDFDTSAVLTCTLGTAYHAVVARGEARLGETAVVTGASGGVGRQALDVLRACGARTIAVTSSQPKASNLKEAGADEAVVAEQGSFAREVKALTGGLGADLVVDTVGGAMLLESIHALRPRGRVVVLGNVEGRKVALPPAYLILKEVSLVGTKSITREEMKKLLELVARGVLKPTVSERFPLVHACEAHRRLEESSGAGRVVLTV